LVKHNAVSDSRYFGDVFDRPFPEPLPRWEDPAAFGTDHWATEDETRADVVGLYQRVWRHADATIEALDLDARGYVPWWQEEVPLFSLDPGPHPPGRPLGHRARLHHVAHRAGPSHRPHPA
jgi:Protein of unknown function (DUF664)